MRIVVKNSFRSLNENRLPNLMKWFIIYLSFTVFLFYFGPIHYNIRNPWLVFLYLSLYHIALILGYHAAEKKCIRIQYEKETEKAFSYRDERRIRAFLWLGLLFTFLTIIRAAQTSNLDAIVSKVVNGIISPAENYSAFNKASADGAYGSGIFSFILTLGLPFCIVGIVLSVFYYKKLKSSSRVLCVVLIVSFAASKLIVSANEGIFDLAIYIGVSLFLRYQSKGSKVKGVSKRRRVLMYVGIGVMIVLALYYFTQNIVGRTKANFAFGTLGENYYDVNAEINKYIPDWIYVTFVYLSVYLCEGYYGFALSTTLDWVPHFGLGFSSFVRNNLSDLFNVDLFQYSYQVRIEEHYNWGSLKNYHTAYTFWANDLSHIGVAIAMFVIGYVFCRCYYGSIRKNSDISIVMMPLLITMLFYLPANNKVFAQPASFLLIFYICMYCLLRQLLKRR